MAQIDKNRIKKVAGKSAVSISAIFLIGLLLMILVHCIPDRLYKSNIEKSAEELVKMENYPYLYGWGHNRQTDMWSEDSLLDFIYNSDSRHPIISALGNISTNNTNSRGFQGGVGTFLSGIENHAAGVDDTFMRPAYWLGYKLYMIPLLSVFDYFTMSKILFIANVIMFIAVCALLVINKETRFAIALAVAMLGNNIWITWHRAVMGSACAAIACIAVVAMLFICRREERAQRELKEYDWFTLFAIIGALTAYFDWWTIPIITLGVPLTYVITKIYRSEDAAFANYFVVGLRSCFGWGIGFAAMVLLRLLACFIFLGPKALSYFGLIAEQDSVGAGGSLGSTLVQGFQAIQMGIHLSPTTNGWLSGNKEFLINQLLIILAGYAIGRTIKKNYAKALLIVASIPFAWFMVFSHHSVVHYWFTYRVFIISTIAITYLLVETLHADLQQIIVSLRNSKKSKEKSEETDEG